MTRRKERDRDPHTSSTQPYARSHTHLHTYTQTRLRAHIHAIIHGTRTIALPPRCHLPRSTAPAPALCAYLLSSPVRHGRRGAGTSRRRGPSPEPVCTACCCYRYAVSEAEVAAAAKGAEEAARHSQPDPCLRACGDGVRALLESTAPIPVLV
jgi:hypothetical protein